MADYDATTTFTVFIHCTMPNVIYIIALHSVCTGEYLYAYLHDMRQLHGRLLPVALLSRTYSQPALAAITILVSHRTRTGSTPNYFLTSFIRVGSDMMCEKYRNIYGSPRSAGRIRRLSLEVNLVDI